MTGYAALAGLLKRVVRGQGSVMDLGHNDDFSSAYNKALSLFSVGSHEIYVCKTKWSILRKKISHLLLGFQHGVRFWAQRNNNKPHSGALAETQTFTFQI